MKLYDAGRAPNPRRVRIFLAEKGLPLPEIVPVDLGKLEHRQPDFTALNPWQRTPVLVLDDGAALSETVAICRYFEELHPEPPLFGAGALERAQVEMWNRRMEIGLLFAVGSAFRHIHPAMAQMETPQIKEWGEANKEKAAHEIGLLDARLADARFVAGPRLTIADITAGTALDMLKIARIEMPAAAGHVRAWHDRLKARPSWAA